MGGFNPLCNSKVNKLKKSGGVGYSEKKLPTALQDAAFMVEYSDFEAAGVPQIEVKTDFVPTEGQKFVIHEFYGTVIVNKYECVCEKVTDEGETAFALGGLVEIYVHGVAPENVKCPWSIVWQGGVCIASYVKEDITEAPYVPRFGALVFFAEAETIHPIDPKFIPGAEVLDLDEYGISLQTIFAAGGGTNYIDTSPLFAKIERGKRYILRGAYGEYFIETEPTYIQYSAEGIPVCIGVTIKGATGGRIDTADFAIFVTGVIHCAVSSVTIPS